MVSADGNGKAAVYLNVYDLTPINGYTYWFGLGIYHSAVQVHGVEYGFGAHEFSSSGVFEVEPKQCPGFTFRKSIYMGTTDLNPMMLREFIEHLAGYYNGNSYNLIVKNCNHFSNDVCLKLTKNPIPRWVNRLARIGLLCNCVLPIPLQVTTTPQSPTVQLYEVSKKQVESSFSCVSGSVRPRQKPTFRAPSVLFTSTFKGPFSPWPYKEQNGVK